MHNPVEHHPTLSSADAAQNMWPGVDELPLPGPQSAAPPLAAGLRPAGNAIRNPAASSDGGADADATQAVFLLAVANLDPWEAWPSLQPLPVPTPVLPPARAASPSPGSTGADDGAA